MELLIVVAFVGFVLFCQVRGESITCGVRGTVSETRLYRECGSNGNYTSDSTYGVNLKTLFSSITSDDQNDFGFYNVTVGEDPDKAYAIALCRGDVTPAECRDCVYCSTVDLPEFCPVEREAIAWYDNCMLRYSNSDIFRDLNGPIYLKWNSFQLRDGAGLNKTLESLLTDLRNKASSGNSLKKYAYDSARYTMFDSIYALVQCTPDLTQRECADCLDRIFKYIPSNFTGMAGARVYRPACNFRYETYRFNDTATSAQPPSSSVVPPPPLPPIAVPSPTNEVPREGARNFSVRNIIIISISTISTVVLVICIYAVIRCNRLRKNRESTDDMNNEESLQFELHTIRVATNNFSNDNMLGRGGFGAVYKGTLVEGQEIAVKRLAENSGQGDFEFKNEVQLLAKLQHRNLVRLLGFCLQGQERLLIYEFVPNASLDQFLFDDSKRANMDWNMRYKIIGGIVRGLLYLHEDSRIRIIHRDLKASNILLDGEMNPKIADFGMARLFVVDQTQGETSRVVGTYGYMAPEYAIYGNYSVKTDIYSFGVLVLELVSGQKSNCFRVGENMEDLVSFAWESWNTGKASEIIDPFIMAGFKDEIMRCIHIGLLCVQESVAARPTMSSVLLMLSSYSLALPVPSKPAFFMHSILEPEPQSSRTTLSNRSTGRVENYTINEVSVTELSPR
ncbi:unnamed protein product [Rhodiola kirilowii]